MSEKKIIPKHVVPGLLGVLLHSVKLCVRVPHNIGKYEDFFADTSQIIGTAYGRHFRFRIGYQHKLALL